MTAREAALQYAGRGWPVLPCRDKVPLVRGGVHAGTRDLATIDAKHRMIALNAESYANLLETGNGRPGADRPYKGGHHGWHQI